MAATRSLLDLMPSVSVTVNFTQLEDLTDDLLRFDNSHGHSSGRSLSKSGSILTLPGKVSRRVPRYDLVDAPVHANVSPTGSSWTSGKATLYDSRRDSTVSTAETIFHDCEDAFDDSMVLKKEDVVQPSPQVSPAVAVILPPKREPTSERNLPPLPAPPQPEPFATLHKTIDAWLVEKDPNVVQSSNLNSARNDAYGQVKHRQQAGLSERDQLKRLPSKERNTWQGDIPGYYGGDKSEDTTAVKGINTSSTQQRGARQRTSPLSPQPPPPVPTVPLHHLRSSPDLSSNSPSNTIVFTTPDHRTPSLQRRPAKEEKEQYQPVITIGGPIRSRSRSHTVTHGVSRKASRLEAEAVQAREMPPYLASPEEARRKMRDMQQDGLEGEAWINKRQRERSQSDAQALTEHRGWSLVSDAAPVPRSTEIPAEHPISPSTGSDNLQARHQSLCLQLTKLQKTVSEMDSVERLQRIKWAGEKAFRDGISTFERSQRESAETQRRQAFDNKRQEYRVVFEQIQGEQKQVKSLIEEGMTYKGKVEQAKRSRSLRMQSADREREQRQQQEQIRLKVKAERRADLRVELTTTANPILAMGFITVQGDDGIRKRRRYELQRDALLFFPENRSAPRGAEYPFRESSWSQEVSC
jgi:hypothetical protein